MTIASRLAVATDGFRCPSEPVVIGAGVVLVDSATIEIVDPTICVEVVEQTINVEIIDTDMELCNG